MLRKIRRKEREKCQFVTSELNAIVSPTLSPVKQEGGSSDEVKDSDAQASKEEWEDVGEGDDGGSVKGGEGIS